MFHRLLVPLDGSARAEQALPLASRIARYYGCTLLLLRVLTTTHDVRLFLRERSALVPDATMEPDLLDATAYLAQMATSSNLSGLKLSVGIVSGTAASSILDVAREQQANLIVMCSHGSTGAKRWMMGNVAQKVARYSPIPVLVMREHGSIPSGPYPDRTRPLRPIKALVALDGSKRAEASLVPTIHLLEALTAPVQGIMHLIQIVSWPSPSSDSGVSYRTHKEEVKAAETYLRSLVDQLEVALGPDLKVAVTWCFWQHTLYPLGKITRAHLAGKSGPVKGRD